METSTGLQMGSSLYVDIESLFDLRLSTIRILFPSIYKKILDEPIPYLGRMSDYIYDVPRSFFKEIYKELVDLDFKPLLKQSKTTSILNILNAELSLIELKKLADIIEGKILNIHVNTFPFTLTDKEAENLTAILKSKLVSSNIELDLIYKDTKLMTTKDLETYDTVIMYRGLDWINFALLMDKFNIPQVKMYVPALLTNGELNVKNTTELENYFNNLIDMFKPIVDLTFLPVELFSINPRLLK